jgi:RNA polymerase sigma-70 factor (ECF subfamily)
LDVLRKRARRGIEEPLEYTAPGEEEAQPRPFFDPKADPVRPIDQTLLSQAIRKAVHELPVDQQIVIVLREIDGMSYNEIAKVTGCRVGTVMSRLFYARKKLQELLKDVRKSAV